ncbi:MFS transporter [Nocardia sp. NPDC051030]|uniref:MFS transporter n=1 Tax=Nocardia sp. NPDC051030 TaxID=3155162 RepID=UPI00341B5B3C
MPVTQRDASTAPDVRRGLVLAICCTAVLMSNLDSTALNVALPSIGRELHTSVAGAQWTVAAYSVTLACLLMFSGALADRVGRKLVFQIGLGVFAAGSLACSLAPSLGWLVAFRIMQAVGGSMLNPVAMAIIAAVFTETAARTRAIGVWSGTTGISMAAGPVAGGVLVDSLGWESVFWINVPIAMIALALTIRYVPESKAARARRMDPIGQLLLAGFLGVLVFAIIEGPHRGWGSVVTVGCFVGAAACALGLAWYEPRRTDPAIELRAFRSSQFTGAVVIAVCAFAGMGGFLFLNTFFLQEVRGDRPALAGLELLPMALALVVSGPISGRLVTRHGARRALTLGAIIVTAAALLLAFTFDSGGQPLLLTGYALLGAGVGLLNTPITTIAVAGLPPAQSGVASAIATTSRQIGQALGVAVIGSIIAAHHDALSSAAAFHAPAQIAWFTITGLGIAAFIVACTTVRPAGSAPWAPVSRPETSMQWRRQTPR